MDAELARQANTFRLERDRLSSIVHVEEERRIEAENQYKNLRAEVSLTILCY